MSLGLAYVQPNDIHSSIFPEAFVTSPPLPRSSEIYEACIAETASLISATIVNNRGCGQRRQKGKLREVAIVTEISHAVSVTNSAQEIGKSITGITEQQGRVLTKRAARKTL